MGDGTLLPVAWLRATRARGGAAMTGHDRMDFFGRAPMDTRYGGWCDLDLRIPGSLNRRFTHMARVASVKMPRLLAFARHVEDSHY